MPEWYIGPPDVGARVDARHDEVERSEHAEPGEHDAQAGRPVHDPRLVDAGDVADRTSGCIKCNAPSAAPEPEYSMSGAATTTSPWRRIARASTWRPSESIAVVVGQQEPGHVASDTPSDERVVPMGSDLRT